MHLGRCAFGWFQLMQGWSLFLSPPRVANPNIGAAGLKDSPISFYKIYKASINSRVANVVYIEDDPQIVMTSLSAKPLTPKTEFLLLNTNPMSGSSSITMEHMDEDYVHKGKAYNYA